MAQSVSVIERDGVRLHVFLSKPVIFEVASVVVETAGEVALVDAQFSTDNAGAVVELIKTIGKPLKTIFISHSDPDYYFGLGVIADAFPDARIVATPQTVWMIEATAGDKMAVWAPQLDALGGLAPKRTVVPEPLAGDHFMVGDVRMEVKRAVGDESHAWLWIPSRGTILGGIYLQQGSHLWIADSPTRQDRDRWLDALDAMEALKPGLAIPAHFTPAHPAKPGLASDAVGAIDFTRKYLTTFEDALGAALNADGESTGTWSGSNPGKVGNDPVRLAAPRSAAVIEIMRAHYPLLGGVGNLEMSARVLCGETMWHVARVFPAIGRKAEVDFGGEFLFELDFTDNRTMTFRGLKPRPQGRPITDTVRYTAVEVAPEVYMVYWTESDNTRVVHVEDYGRGIAYTNIAAPDGSFTNLRGTLRLVETPKANLADAP